MLIRDEALDILRETSRTFYIPISRLPAGGLQDAVMAGYLCLRAVDEVEDHPDLDNQTKAMILRSISRVLQTDFDCTSFDEALEPWASSLQEVTLRVGDWALLAPESIAPRVWEATSTMAERMAGWAEDAWEVRTETDLDRYTFSVAGSVGLLLSDLWAWYDGTQTSRVEAVGFGRALQTVNILRNRTEDLQRGVDFFPCGWGMDEVRTYAYRQLALAQTYTSRLSPGPVLEFCVIPLALAHATLETMANGHQKLNRGAVLQIVSDALAANGLSRGDLVGS